MPSDSDKLKSYRDKRDASATPEPMGEAPRRPSSTRNGAFVVHLHHATGKHYDLRLEIGGVLVSFAVPHGPTLDPEKKVLAIQTEDHPIEYLAFEAVIPKGQYGAGPMIAWDRGGVRYLDTTAEDGLVSGKLDFVLTGFKLKGRFALVKLAKSDKGNEWLLIKKNDAFAQPGTAIIEVQTRSVLSGLSIDELLIKGDLVKQAQMQAIGAGATIGVVNARSVEPMLCASAEESEMPTGGYTFELKLDGVRILGQKDKDGASLTYRSHRDASAAYPEIVEALEALAPERVVLDGEIVAFDEEGLPKFQLLSQRIGGRGSTIPVQYLVFDVLAIEELDLRDVPLVARRQLLRKILPGGGFIRPLDYLEKDGRALFDFCRARRMEGVVAKRADSPYRTSKKRTRDWIKIKCERDESFVVIGWTRGNEGRSRLGALELAAYDENGVLTACGKAGSGLDEKTIDVLLPQLEALKTDKKMYAGDPGDAPLGRTMVKPEIVVSVRFLGFSDEGLLRFPSFRGVDHDRQPKDCTVLPHRDELKTPTGDDEEAPLSTAAPQSRRVALTNQQKIFWPKDGYTKGDLCSYYEAIAPTILPYLRDRPIVVVRYPDGIAGKSFFQWNIPFGFPKWMRHAALGDEDEDTKNFTSPPASVNNRVAGGQAALVKKRVFLVDDAIGLLTLANTGAIPMHILACREQSIHHCDFCTIDFDVDLASFAHGVTLAFELRRILDDIGLVGFPKTSGQSGLHVLIPLGPGVSFDTASALNVLLGRLVTAAHQDIATMEMSVQKRGAKVFVDVGQTGKRRTIVAPYSVRAKDGAPVSTPLRWEEVTPELDTSAFTIRTVPARVAKDGDPMRAMLEQTPNVPAAIQKLGKRLGG